MSTKYSGLEAALRSARMTFTKEAATGDLTGTEIVACEDLLPAWTKAGPRGPELALLPSAQHQQQPGHRAGQQPRTVGALPHHRPDEGKALHPADRGPRQLPEGRGLPLD